MSFYRKIVAGKTVEEAVTDGRRGIAACEPSSFEWTTPVLFLRTREGRSLTLKKDKKKMGRDVEAAGRTTVKVETVQAGIVYIIGHQHTGGRPDGDVEVNEETVGGKSIDLTRGGSHERLQAARQLGYSRNPQGIRIVEQRWDDEIDPSVRYWLAHALGMIGGPRAIEVLLRLRSKEDNRLPLRGVEEALNKAGNPNLPYKNGSVDC